MLKNKVCRDLHPGAIDTCEIACYLISPFEIVTQRTDIHDPKQLAGYVWLFL